MGIRWTGYIFLENLERALRFLKNGLCMLDYITVI